MKKLLLFFILLFPAYGFCQIKHYRHIEFGTGVSMAGAGLDVAGSSNMMWSVSVSLSNLHFDFASNFAKGRGEYMNWNTSQSYKADKTNVTSMALGWNIRACRDKLIITPRIGLTTSSDIINDPVGFDTYYESDKIKKFLGGVMIKYFFTDWMGVGLASASTQPINFQIFFRL